MQATAAIMSPVSISWWTAEAGSLPDLLFRKTCFTARIAYDSCLTIQSHRCRDSYLPELFTVSGLYESFFQKTLAFFDGI